MSLEPTLWQGLHAWRLHGADGSCALVAAQGAQLLSWATADGRERLYRSPRAQARAGGAIRGGMPVVFPQFGARGPLPKHGFARTADWRLAEAGDARLLLVLDDDAATRAVWPHAFRATLAVRLGAQAIEVELGVENRGDDAFEFGAALHTYLRTAGPVRLGPLDGEALVFDGAIDRVFADAPATQRLHDAGSSLAITRHGFPDTVVWNPGAAPLPDLPPGDWREFLCVEAACAARPVRLGPGERWRGSQRLEVIAG